MSQLPKKGGTVPLDSCSCRRAQKSSFRSGWSNGCPMVPYNELYVIGLRHHWRGQLHQGEELGEGAPQDVGHRDLPRHRRKQGRHGEGEARVSWSCRRVSPACPFNLVLPNGSLKIWVLCKVNWIRLVTPQKGNKCKLPWWHHNSAAVFRLFRQCM